MQRTCYLNLHNAALVKFMFQSLVFISGFNRGLFVCVVDGSLTLKFGANEVFEKQSQKSGIYFYFGYFFEE